MKPHVFLASLALAAVATSQASAAAPLECKMRFDLSGWSVIYKQASGKGVVTCSNGQSMRVVITARGGGLTVGKTEIHDGVGNFSDVHKITDVLGTYAQGGAEAAAGKAATAQVLTKGKVSLALAGKGEGVALGISIGGMTLKRDTGK